MNYSTAILLVRKDIRAVEVSYEVDKDGNGVRPFTTYKTPDKSIKAGDYVVIPTDTRHNMTVARIETVDVDVDFDSPVQMKWLVGPAIDTESYTALLAAEADAVVAIRSAETRRKREELAAKLIADNPDLERLGSLDVAAALAAPVEN